MNNAKQNRYLSTIQRYMPNVNRVADSTKSLIVEVTKADVRRGEQKEPDNCAMVKAIVRCGDADAAVVRRHAIYLVRGDLAIRYVTSPRLARELVAFDRSRDFEPGEYILSRICPCRRIGVDKRPRAGGGKGKTSGTARVCRRTTNIRG